MKILHTSDWHLGKYLEKISRLKEQRVFLDELVTICEEDEIDLVIVAGDIYDTYNPPIEAERLFFEGLDRLSNGGKRPVVVIAGNHDNPDKISAPVPLAEQRGIILVSLPKTVVNQGVYEHYKITSSYEGCFEIELNGEKAIIATMAYPSEKRLNEIISCHSEEAKAQQDYSQKVGILFEECSKYFREDTINIVIGHFYVTGGEVSDSERDISLGGAYSVDARHLPQNAQYIAMGHLHRPQRVKGIENGYYSGSPIQYSKSERGYAKSVYIANLNAGETADVEKRALKIAKSIEVWKLTSVEEALKLCEDRKDDDIYVYLELELSRVLEISEIRALKSAKTNIVDIELNIRDDAKVRESVDATENKPKTLIEEFTEFYANERNAHPTEEVISMLTEIIEEDML